MTRSITSITQCISQCPLRIKKELELGGRVSKVLAQNSKPQQSLTCSWSAHIDFAILKFHASH